MSCFIMRVESIRTLAYTLDSVFNAATFSNTLTITTFAVCCTDLCNAFADCIRSQSYDGEMIAAALYRINAEAYSARYREEVSAEIPARIPGTTRSQYSLYAYPVIEEHMERPQDWHFHLTSLLDCWLYQTDEDATRENKKRLALRDFARNLKCQIVNHSLQYSKYRWGE